MGWRISKMMNASGAITTDMTINASPNANILACTITSPTMRGPAIDKIGIGGEVILIQIEPEIAQGIGRVVGVGDGRLPA